MLEILKDFGIVFGIIFLIIGILLLLTLPAMVQYGLLGGIMIILVCLDLWFIKRS